MNIEDEIVSTFTLIDSGAKLAFVDGKLLAESPAISAPMLPPDIRSASEIRDPLKDPTSGAISLPASPFPGQSPASVALGVPGEPGAAAPIKPTDFSNVGWLAKGLGEFAKQTGNLAMAIGPAAVNKTLQEAINFGAEVVDAIGNTLGTDPQALNAVRNFIPQIGVDGGVANFTKDISSFVWSFALLRRLGAGNIPAGAVADALQKPEEGNLSTLAKNMGFNNELLEFLDSKVGEDASAEERLVARLKNSLEGIGIGAAVDGIVLGIKALKANGGKNVENIKNLLRDEELAKGGGTVLFSTPVIGGVARPKKGAITKFDKKTGETSSDYVKRLNREAPIVLDADTFTKTYGAMPATSDAMPSPAVALRTTAEREGTPQLTGGTLGDKKTFAPASAQVGAYFDSLVRMKNNGNPRSWSVAADKEPILKEAANEVIHQIGLAKPGSSDFTKVTGWGWYDEDIAKAFNTAGPIAPELKTGAKRGIAIPSEHWGADKGMVTPAEARILVAAVGAPQSFGNPALRNFDIALQAYEIFRKTGQFPERGMIRDEAGNVVPTGKYWTQRGVSEQYIGVLNTLLREVGPGETARWLTKEHTVAELRGLKRRSTNAARNKIFKGDTSMGISGKADEMRLGAYVFGPKGGQFLANLTGYGGTTTDMWFTRTWNRYLGRSREGQGAIADTGVVEQPRNLKERGEMADFSKALTDMLNKDGALVSRLGRPLLERDTQAVLWYFEQNLYRDMGIPVTPTSFGEGADAYAKRAKEQGGTGIKTVEPQKPKRTKK